MAPVGRGSPPFALRISQADDIATVRVTGALDLASSGLLRAVLQTLTGGGATVTVDLGEATHLDAHSIGMLLATHQSAGKHGLQLMLSGARGRVLRVLEITGVDKLLSDDPPPATVEDTTVDVLLAARQRTASDPAVREGLRQLAIVAAFDLAGRLSHAYRHRGEPDDDLEQVAVIGLIKAVDGYDPDRGCPFLGYAVPTVRGELRRYFRDRGWRIRVPRRLQELGLAVNASTGELSQALGRAPTVAELAVHLNADEGEVRDALAAAHAYRPRSLSAPAGVDQAVEGTELGDLIGSTDDGFELVENRETLRELLPSLPPREQRILALRFYGNQTQAQIAEQVGVSQMQVSRLLTGALGRLRRGLVSDS